MASGYELHNQLLVDRNLIRPRQPPAVTSTVTTDQHVQYEAATVNVDEPARQAENSTFDGEAMIFDIPELDQNEDFNLSDLLVFDGDEHIKDN